MKPSLKFSASVFLIGVIFYISCKKEVSCEGNCIDNKPPTANAGPDQKIILPTDSILLDGSNSTDVDGKIVSYKWKKIAGPVSSLIIKDDSSKTNAKTLLMGVYQFELKVTDNGGLSAKDTVQIIVDDPSINQPPVANAGSDQVITLPTDSISLNGSASFDPDGTIISYKWIKISGPFSSSILDSDSSKTLVKPLVQGIYQFELKVTDNAGLFSKDTIQVTVNTAVVNNLPPVAKAGNDTTIQSNQTSCIALPLSVNLNGSNSYDPDGNIMSYLWTGPGNITNPNSATTTVNGTFQGTVFFILKVTDNKGAFNYDTIMITIIPINRPLVPVQVTQVASLPQQASMITARAVAIAGNKIVFAGGSQGNSPASARVDIYNISTDVWTTATLSQGRFSIGVAVLGNKIFFAGGIVPRLSSGLPVDPIGAGSWYSMDIASFRSTVIDIYDASTNTWSIDHLSNQRVPVGVTVNNKVIFAGSDVSYQSPGESSKIDIYEAGTLTTAVMSEPRDLNQPAVGNAKVYFPGGSRDLSEASGGGSGGLSSKRIDIYDASTGSWSVDNLSIDRFWMGNIVANNKLYCGGGMIWNASINDWNSTNSVEIRDLSTNTTSFDCLHEAKPSWALKKDNKIIFFGGTGPDIFDLSTNSWSIGVLSQTIGRSIILYNNIIYTTDGNKVWKLDF